jgi:polysaccharide export outer membrane protein
VIRKRNGKTTKETLDVVEMIRNGDLNRDFDLAANDVIYVERAPRFYIYGEVQRPGAFRLERDDRAAGAVGRRRPDPARHRARHADQAPRRGRQAADDRCAKRDDLVQIDDVVYVKESWF